MSVKDFYVVSPEMLQTDFMWGVSGRGCTFNVNIKYVPDYSNDWETISIINQCNNYAAIRLSFDKTIDMLLEPGEHRYAQMDQVRGYPMNSISKFIGEYRFLSNFSDSIIRYNGHTYNSVESAFQAQKSHGAVDLLRNMSVQEALEAKRRPIIDPGEAKRIGRRVPVRKDWEQVKDRIMLEVLVAKFTQNERDRQSLLDTGNAILVEGNTWHDNYWGWCQCPNCALEEHHNKLGRLLMQIRDALKEDKNPLEVIKVD